MTLKEQLAKDELVKIRGDIAYQAYFGDAVAFTYNGLLVRLELNGQEQEFPETIAKEIQRRLNDVVRVSMPTKSNEKVADLAI